jgi:hypothetical protein
MKNITKATVTLALGIGLLVGTAGIASASPHITEFNGVIEEPVKASVTSPDQNLQPNIRTTGGMTNLEHGPGLHDSVHCLRNIKDVVSLEHGPGLHDSVHCLHNNGAFEAGNRVNNYFSRGLHNNGAFLPWHRG